jgi:hypothetical protein
MRIRVHSQAQANGLVPRRLSAGRDYLVIGISDEYFRVVNDGGEPILYPKELFEVINDTIPSDWVREDFEDGEYHIEPPEVAFPGFYEDYFDHKDEARRIFEQVLARLEKVCGPRSS